MSVVKSNRKQLEAIGDYVTRVNVDWFASFPDKLAEFEQVAAENDRKSHMIVYRTQSDNVRDHQVIPISILSDLFTKGFQKRGKVQFKAKNAKFNRRSCFQNLMLCQ